MNFVYGQNGAGKSSIMAGLILGRLPLLLPSPTVPADAMPGFGGSAADVQWENLAAGIRYGQDVASVTLGICNEGLDAYKPDLYGSVIVIRRDIIKLPSNKIGTKYLLLCGQLRTVVDPEWLVGTTWDPLGKSGRRHAGKRMLCSLPTSLTSR